MTKSGADVSRSFYVEVVRPILEARWPSLPHAAGRLGSGSDVLGLDDQMSRDHDWGLRLNLLVDDHQVREVRQHLEVMLPISHASLPVRFPVTWDQGEAHRVQVDSPHAFLRSRLGADPLGPLTNDEWLSLTGQSVLEVTAGEVFADTADHLAKARRRLEWYPDDLWLYVVAAAWKRIEQDLHILGRLGTRQDRVGEQVQAARLVNLTMNLGFLLERRWAPYPKWFGVTFSGLPRAHAALPALSDCLSSETSESRQTALATALEFMHELQRDLGLPCGDRALEQFWDRPFLGVSSSVVPMLLEAISDPALGREPALGSIEQWSASVDVLTSPRLRLVAQSALDRSR